MRSSLDVERMQLSDDPEDFAWGRWEWCQEGALPMPFLHAFACPVWETDRDYVQGGAGFSIEERKRRRRGEPYVPPKLGTERNEYRPARTTPFPGQGFRGTRQQWREGLGQAERIDGDQAPLCGGVSWDSRLTMGFDAMPQNASAGYADVSVGPEGGPEALTPIAVATTDSVAFATLDLATAAPEDSVALSVEPVSEAFVGPGSGGFVFTFSCPYPGVPASLRLTYGNDWSDQGEALLLYSEGTGQWQGTSSGPRGDFVLHFYDVGGGFQLLHEPPLPQGQQLFESFHVCIPFQWQSAHLAVNEGGPLVLASASIVPGP